jgi:hypothetical protein
MTTKSAFTRVERCEVQLQRLSVEGPVRPEGPCEAAIALGGAAGPEPEQRPSVLLWTFLTSVALFFGLAVAAQLEAVRAGVPEPRIESQTRKRAESSRL